MVLRKVVAAGSPLLACILLSIVFRWLDSMAWLSAFWSFAIKGALLGVALALILPAAGVSSRMNGLQAWVLVGAGLLVALLLLQYLAFVGILQLALLDALGKHFQLVLAEGAAVGFLLVTTWINRRR